MRNLFFIAIIFLCSGLLWAQKQSTAIIPSDVVIMNYLNGAKAYASLYTGKAEAPYNVPYTNHPYFETADYIQGTLCYNHVVYKDVLMRWDLFRDEITVKHPDHLNSILLNNEKFNYAILNGSVIIKSAADRKTKERFVVLLHNGAFPVVKIHNIGILEEQSGRVVRRYFSIQPLYAIHSDGMLYAVKNKNAILKLFPDRKKELNEYARLHKLNFSKQTGQSIIALVDYYENIMSQ